MKNIQQMINYFKASGITFDPETSIAKKEIRDGEIFNHKSTHEVILKIAGMFYLKMSHQQITTSEGRLFFETHFFPK